MPSFVGNKIRDIGGFESRLVFVAGGACIMSRTNEPVNFFRKSAVAQVDSDPIDITSSKEGELTLDWIVPFDKTLILLSDPGDAQFVVAGGGLTPSNASMVLTTEYEMFGSARPVTTGRTMIFPFRSGEYSGIKEFFTNDEVATNGADTITQVQDTYIVGTVNYLATSKNFNLITAMTDSIEEPHSKTLWVYRYLWDGSERVQSSWGKWIFTQEVVWNFFDNSRMYLILKQDTDVYSLEVLDLNKTPDNAIGYHVTIDGRVNRTITDGAVTVPYPGATFVQRTNNVGVEAVAISEVMTGSYEWTYEFDPEIFDDGVELVAGRRFEREVIPTMPLLKNNKGQTISSAKITVAKFIVHHEDTGEVDYEMSSPYRAASVYKPHRYPLDDEPLDPSLSQLSSGPVEVPWGERTDYTDFTIRSDDIRPMTIIEIEWEGQVTGAKRRL
jgi:hypothetical protein